jgi:hypothetical protein
MTAEQLAQKFHETYERLAPEHGYETRKASAVPWADVPPNNKALMIAVCAEIIKAENIAGLPLDAEGRTPFGSTCKEHLDAAIEWIEGCGWTVHAFDCTVHQPSARCSCGLHKCLTDLRAVQSFAGLK